MPGIGVNMPQIGQSRCSLLEMTCRVLVVRASRSDVTAATHAGGKDAPVARCCRERTAAVVEALWFYSRVPMLRVVMPVHNGGRFLDAALASVLGDLPEVDAQLVVVDDGSSDDSPAIIARHARDARVSVLTNVAARGVSAALNQGIDAEGEAPTYVAVAEHDDLTVRGRFEAEMAALDADPSLGAVSCNGRYVGADGRVVGRVASGPTSAEAFARQKAEGRAILVPHPCVMYRYSALESVGLYDETFDGAQDLELMNRLIYSGGWQVRQLPFDGIRYRMHSSSMSFAKMSTQRLMDQYIWGRNRATLDGQEFPDFVTWRDGRQLSRGQRLSMARRDRGALMFRRAGMAWLARRPVRFAVNLLGASLLHPRWVLLKLRRLSGAEAV